MTNESSTTNTAVNILK